MIGETLRHAAEQPPHELAGWLSAQLAAMERQAELERRDLAPLLEVRPGTSTVAPGLSVEG